MSILIKGMRMPENCIECPMQFGGMCYVMPAEVDESRVAPTVEEALEQGKPDWCPLVEIPEPHGDLIDRKAPEIIFCKDCRKHNVKVGFDENFHTVWKEDACPLVDWRGKAKEHEFDYQYCAFAERKTE